MIFITTSVLVSHRLLEEPCSPEIQRLISCSGYSGHWVSLCPEHTAQSFWDTGPRKHLREYPIFYYTVLAHIIWFFMADKKSDPPYQLLSECHLAHTARIFYRSYRAMTKAGEVPLLDYVTSIFCRTGVGTHELIFYSWQIVGQKVQFLLDQKLVHTIRFSHFFLLR